MDPHERPFLTRESICLRCGRSLAEHGSSGEEPESDFGVDFQLRLTCPAAS